MKYVAYNDMPSPNHLAGVPKHWGEVVMTSRRGEKKQTKRLTVNRDAGVNGEMSENGFAGNEVFETLLIR